MRGCYYQAQVTIIICKVIFIIPFTSQGYTVSAWAGLRAKLILPMAISTDHVNAVYTVLRCKHKQALDSIVKRIVKITLS